MKNQFLAFSEILKKAAKEVGATIVFEPIWKVVGQIQFKNGKKRYFYSSKFDINGAGSTRIADDKDYAKFFLDKNNYKVAKGKSFCSPTWAKAIGSKDTVDTAYTYAEKHLKFPNKPIIMKPNGQSHGKGVFKVHSKKEFYKAFTFISGIDNLILVEECLMGNEYRIVVLDNTIVATYERKPFFVVGDGTSTIEQLIHIALTKYKQIGRYIQHLTEDTRLKARLDHIGKDISSIPKKDEVVTLLDNANLSSGGVAFDVSREVHPSIKKLAINITKDMGLRLCGVDIMLSKEIGESLEMQKYWIIEINASPGLSHYMTLGKEQQNVVVKLYKNVLKGLK